MTCVYMVAKKVKGGLNKVITYLTVSSFFLKDDYRFGYKIQILGHQNN